MSGGSWLGTHSLARWLNSLAHIGSCSEGRPRGVRIPAEKSERSLVRERERERERERMADRRTVVYDAEAGDDHERQGMYVVHA